MERLLDKIVVNKLYILLVIILALLAGSTASWIYLENDVPPKIPVRAKQVLLP